MKCGFPFLNYSISLWILYYNIFIVSGVYSDQNAASIEAGTTQADTVCKLTEALMTADVHASQDHASQSVQTCFLCVCFLN